ncbi:MagZ family protein [Erysipelothrix larvae]|uniref:MagZ family protein n=2 Tax=Erysipelothrix larvae TaxID=1514105 RepID=A0A109UH45_9FIRM|nr:MagZ family protein [Erysipelothrix larvae]
MTEIFEIIDAMRKQFGWDQSDTKETMSHFLLDEAKELVESLNEPEEAFKKELADVLMYAFAICMDEGYDVKTLIEDKANEVKQREY